MSVRWKEENVPHEAFLRSEDGEIFRGFWRMEKGSPPSDFSHGQCIFTVYQRRRHLVMVGRYDYNSKEYAADLASGWFWTVVGNRVVNGNNGDGT
jgi:hypothetical protein